LLSSSILVRRPCVRAISQGISSIRWNRSILSPLYVRRDCLLVQLQEYVTPEHIFSEYAYFSAYSDAWLDHALTMTERLGLGSANRVIELGRNDGYLLQFFVERGGSVLGIDPAVNIAGAAE
jgi:hypothetical protein